nr:response regulator [uncultured Roseateles sp.]
MPNRRTLLLVEPDSLFRRTVALTARELNLADVHEASSHEAAQRLLASQRFDAMLLDIDDALTGLALLHSVRGGGTLSKSDLPMAVIAGTMDASTIALLKPLCLQRIMLKPFKVKTVLEVVSSLAGRMTA